MKIRIILLSVIILLVINNLLVYVYPVSPKELEGNYTSLFENIEYTMVIKKNGYSVITAKNKLNNKILNIEQCKKIDIKNIHYRTLPIHTVSFSKCSDMDFDAYVDRDLFGIKIGNNGTEMKRIDPDLNVYFRKI